MDGGTLFNGYEPDAQTLTRIAVFTAVFLLIYGWVWY